MIAIIIINWNGFEDTIECIDSLQKCEGADFFIVVCDNGSTNESVNKIVEYCNDRGVFHKTYSYLEEVKERSISNKGVIINKLGENYGFSKGNNLGIQFSKLFEPDYYLLLNNDTVVEPVFLKTLVDFQKRNTSFKVLTPLIRYFDYKDIVWNGGGNINWGFKSYHYPDCSLDKVPRKEYIPCSFISGCALFFVPELLDAEGRLLTEKFFFGEEDFEFGLRMKKSKTLMACVLNSNIYHKVGRSRNKNKSRIGDTYIYYLNRLIDVKDYMPLYQYIFFKFLTLLQAVRTLVKYHGLGIEKIFLFIRQLNFESSRNNRVTKEMFLSVVNNDFFDKK